MAAIDASAVKKLVETSWTESIEQTLCQYIAIPNQSPEFDPEWETNGLLDQAANLFVSWAKAQNLAGTTIELIKDAGHTPLIFIEVAPTLPTDQTVLLYGHMDKQPPMAEKWEAGLGPHTPVIRDGKLYGRGGADDGYAIFGALTAIKVLQVQRIPHARCVVIIEGCEESDQPDLLYYLNKLSARIGTPNLVVCLDSGCGNYDQLWITSSLRGLVNLAVHVKVLSHGQHSGEASGLAVETTRVLRQLLDRVENSKDGQILIPEFNRAIPPKFVQYAKDEGKEIGPKVVSSVPFLKGVAPVSADHSELILNKTWRPTLCITGADGFPPISQAGNVLRPETAVKLSIRIPPGVDENKAKTALKDTLQKDVPYGAHVVFDGEDACPGWAEPDVAPWLEASVQRASKEFFGKPALRTGEGGSIPFMGMLAEKFPQAQFVITGVLGPQSNAHGPNEFLHIGFTKNVMGCIAIVLADHFFHTQQQKS